MFKYLIPFPGVLIISLGCILIGLIQYTVHQSTIVYKGPCHFVSWVSDEERITMKVKFDNDKEGITADTKALVLIDKNKTLIGELDLSGNITFSKENKNGS